MAQIDELKANIRNGQELWMLQQGTLVGLSKDLETNSRMILELKTWSTGMKRKKIHLESMNHLQTNRKRNKEFLTTTFLFDLRQIALTL